MRILPRVILISVFCALIGIQPGGNRRVSSAAGLEPQDVSYLDRRVSILETRLGSIESSLRSLEQQALSQRPAASQPARDPESALFRSELEILKARLREVECGLAHIDERTLSASVREARKRMNAEPNEPCRLNPEASVPISPRR